LFTSLFQDKEVNGFGQSPIEKITKRLFEAQLFTLKTQRFVFFESGIRALLFYLKLNGLI